MTYEFAETESVSPPNARRLVPKAVQEVIKQDIERYRYDFVHQSPEPNAALMVGLELSTGLLDRLITKVVKQCKEVSVEQHLIDMGVPVEHANTILSILNPLTSEFCPILCA